MSTSLNEYFTERVINWMSTSLIVYFTEWVLHWMKISLNEYLASRKTPLHISRRSHPVKCFHSNFAVYLFSVVEGTFDIWCQCDRLLARVSEVDVPVGYVRCGGGGGVVARVRTGNTPLPHVFTQAWLKPCSSYSLHRNNPLYIYGTNSFTHEILIRRCRWELRLNLCYKQEQHSTCKHALTRTHD